MINQVALVQAAISFEQTKAAAQPADGHCLGVSSDQDSSDSENDSPVQKTKSKKKQKAADKAVKPRGKGAGKPGNGKVRDKGQGTKDKKSHVRAWTLAEEKTLVREHHEFRKRGGMSNPGIWREKYRPIAKQLNDMYYCNGTDDYPYIRDGQEVYDKLKNLKWRWDKEQKAKKRWKNDTNEGQTGSSAREGWQSSWTLYEDYYHCMFAGNPAEEKEQPVHGTIARSIVLSDFNDEAGSGDDDDKGADDTDKQLQTAGRRPTMTKREQHGAEFLKQTCEHTLSMDIKSERAAALHQDAAALRQDAILQAQFDLAMYNNKSKVYTAEHAARQANNANIVKLNEMRLEIWRSTKGTPPQLQELDNTPMRHATPPKAPAEQIAEARAEAVARQDSSLQGLQHAATGWCALPRPQTQHCAL
ncbi:hypothetical protein WJX79_010955 [Trebouxia sp. C0005]